MNEPSALQIFTQSGLHFQCAKGEPNQVGELLDTLSRGDVDTMDKFIYSLKACPELKWVADTHLREPLKPDPYADANQGGSSATGN